MASNNTSMDTKEFVSFLKTSKASSNFKIVEEGFAPFPQMDIQTASYYLSAVFYAKIEVDGDPDNYYSTFTSCYRDAAGNPHFFVWCGDKFFEGTLAGGPSDARNRCESSLKASAAPLSLIPLMMVNYNKFPIPTNREKCSFWANWRKDRTLCDHTEHLLAKVTEKFGTFEFADLLLSKYDEYLAPSAEAGSEDAFAVEELAFKVPILIVGDRGSGKTWEAREFADKKKVYLCELGGHQGIESVDMLGSFAPLGGSQFIWKDGPLSEAFRRARKEPVVLIIDEILRIPQRELSILLTAFSPTKKKTYRIRTGRIKQTIQSDEDGMVGVEEILECPVENLCVIATTNVGSEFAVDECDPAVAERFVLIQKDTSPERLRAILAEVAKQKNFSPEVVKKTLKFYTTMGKLVSKGLVQKMPTTRTLARAFTDLSSSENEVFRGLKAQHLLWVARDSEGNPVQEQVKAVFEALDKSFKE